MSRILKKILAQHELEMLRNFLRKDRIGAGLERWGHTLIYPLIEDPCIQWTNCQGLVAMLGSR